MKASAFAFCLALAVTSCRRKHVPVDRAPELPYPTCDAGAEAPPRYARTLRAAQPNAWVGLYAYSSHRLPPTIDVEPNVYVQVAMGFNRTEYTLPELVLAQPAMYTDAASASASAMLLKIVMACPLILVAHRNAGGRALRSRRGSHCGFARRARLF